MINVMNTQDSAYDLVDLVVFQFGVIVRYIIAPARVTTCFLDAVTPAHPFGSDCDAFLTLSTIFKGN